MVGLVDLFEAREALELLLPLPRLLQLCEAALLGDKRELGRPEGLAIEWRVLRPVGGAADLDGPRAEGLVLELDKEDERAQQPHAVGGAKHALAQVGDLDHRVDERRVGVA